MLVYCFEHAMENLSEMQYWDSKSMKGKFITPVPPKLVTKHKCYGTHGNSCNRWGRFFIEIISKKGAFISRQHVFQKSPIKKSEELALAKALGVLDKDTIKAINVRYRKTGKLGRLD